MKTRLLKCIGVFIGLIFIFSLLPQSAAEVVWEDDFETGMDGWTVIVGHWRVADGMLEAYYVDDLDHRISHPSSQVVGTWSFDMYHPSAECYTTMWFITNGTDTPDENYGYGLRIGGDLIYMVKLEGDYLSSSPIAGAVYESDDDFEDVWIHINITRDSAGEFNVYFNETSTIAEPIFSCTDTEYNYSTRMLIDFGGAVVEKFDNIVVDDEILITPLDPTPTPTPTSPTSPTSPETAIDTTLLIAAAGVGGVVIIAAVVCMRRR